MKAATIADWREHLMRIMIVRPDLTRPHTWIGWLDGHELTFAVAVHIVDDARVGVTIPIASDFHELMAIDPDEALSSVGRFETGDPAFDEAVALFAPDELAWRFDAAMRRDVIELVESGGMIAGGLVCLPASADIAAESIPGLVKQMASIATRLGPVDRVTSIEALAHIVREDPDDGVRARFRELANSPEHVVAAARQAIASASGADALALLERQLHDVSLPASARGLAAARLVGLASVEALLALPSEVWADTTSDDVGPGLLDRVARAPAGERAAWASLAWRVVRASQGAANMKLTTLAFESMRGPLTPEDERALDRLVGHSAPAIASLAARAMTVLASSAALLERASRARWVDMWRMRELGAFLQRSVALIRAGDADPRELARGLAILTAVVHPVDLTATWALDVVSAMTIATREAPQREACDVLIELVEHTDPSVRHRALGTLMRLTELATPDAPEAESIVKKLPGSTMVWVYRHAPLCATEHDAGIAILAVLLDQLSEADGALQASYLATMAALLEHRPQSTARVHAIEHMLAQLEGGTDNCMLTAIDALARIGRHEDVGPLERLTRGVFRGADVKARARAAIDAILGRYGDPQGGLSMAEGGAGAVSLTDD